MTEWRRTRLKYLVDTNASVLPEDTDPDYEFTYVDIGNVTQGSMNIDGETVRFATAPSRARRLAHPGDSVVSTVRTYLRAVATVPASAQPLVFSTGFAVLHPRTMVHSGFLSWYLQGDDFVARVESHSTGVSYPAITASQLISLDLLLPPLAEQHAIADYLDRETAKIDTLIEAQQRFVELLRKRRRAVEEGAVSRLKWTVPLRSLTRLIQTGPFGSQLKSDEYEVGGVPVINPSHIIDGAIVPSPSVAVGMEKATELARHTLHEGDVIAARRGELGRCAAVGQEAAGYLCGTGSAVIRPDLRRVNPRFLALAFGSRRNRDALSLASVGSTMDNLNSSIIGGLRVPLPPLEEQRRIVAYLDEQTSKIDRLIAESERFIELSRKRRSALITAAVTGQIDVRDEVA